jgi:type IV pilus biogenesis protein CpaD/CtpE
MKNTFSRVLLGFVALALSGCANYTLITIKVDVASLVGEAALKTTLQFSTPTLLVNETVPNKPEGQLIDNFPKLDVLNSAKLDILVLTGDGSGNTAKISGSVRVYVAPTTETNIYQDSKYLISNTNAATATSSIQINFELAPTGASPTPEQQIRADALKAIQTGKFRVGVKIGGTFDGAQTKLELALKTFKINISGYPIKLVPAP